MYHKGYHKVHNLRESCNYINLPLANIGFSERSSICSCAVYFCPCFIYADPVIATNLLLGILTSREGMYVMALLSIMVRSSVCNVK